MLEAGQLAAILLFPKLFRSECNTNVMRAQATAHTAEQPLDAATVIEDLTDSLRETAQEVVPWFFEQMPQMYFQDTKREAQLTHLRAILAAKASGRPLELTIRSKDGSEWTAMRPRNAPGVLAELVAELPHDRPLLAAKIHTAMDGQLVLDTFIFGQGAHFDAKDAAQAEKLRATIAFARENAPNWSEAAITEFFNRCTADYVRTLTPLRMHQHWLLVQQITGTDSTIATLEPEADPTQSRITLVLGNSTTRTMLERVARRLSQSQINIHRAYLDIIEDGANGSISLLGFVVNTPEGGAVDPDSELWRRVKQDLERLKWVGDDMLEMTRRHPDLELVRAEVIIGLCNLAHQKLVKVNAYAFDRSRIRRLAERHLSISQRIVELLMDRFDPAGPLDDAAYEERAAQIRGSIDGEVDLEDARTLLHTMLKAVDATLRTNIHLKDRYAFALRIDPGFLQTKERDTLPYGVFFVNGRAFTGFHVRFRDIARGGVRAILPRGADQFALECERLYDEAFGLASAQQLKNKDIPEGGAKAAILLEPGALVPRSVKGFVDALLDLITPEPATKSRIINRFAHDEILYLGPDENITPELISWIVDRARRRGYSMPSAFMSSKPGAGINHKEYGVTSEGVTVFLDVALKHIGIDPRSQPFTVKITGGPDGDVAGNEIKILHREYGKNARIVGIADGSGSAEDPNGLDHEELLRLVARSAPVREFDRNKLSSAGRLATLDDPEGVNLRNTLHNRVIADAFIPAGGRPNTIHAGNWKQYLTKDGSPSSRLIVEGANLFLTPEARRHLSERGVLIIKDSSANKCGVICSSFEISACMILDEKEFLANKEKFVGEVLQRLRTLARLEAELLLRVNRHHPHIPLPDMSARLSQVMMRTADAIFAAMDHLLEAEPELMRKLVIDHLPPLLVSVAGKRLWERVPDAYLRSIMAKTLSARIVYRESFEALEMMPLGSIAEFALQYLRLEQERDKLIKAVAGSGLADKQRIAEVLARSSFLSAIGKA